MDPENNMTTSIVSHLLKKHARGPLFLDIPNSFLGPLRLDIADLTVMAIAQGKVSQEMQADAQARFQAGRALWNSQDPAPSIAAMRELTRLHPTLDIGHDALMLAHQHLKDFPEAAYHCGQLVAVQPTYKAVNLWARLLGRSGQLEDACDLLEFLYAAADAAVSPTDGHPLSAEEVKSVAHNLLVTLTRLQRGASMVEVAEAQLKRHGAQPNISHQAAVGHLFCGQIESARAHALPLLAWVKPGHPLHAPLQRMRPLLDVSDSVDSP